MRSPTEEFWEGHYRQRSGHTGGRPNPVLADVAGPLVPGTALDLGCGEGGDALWLAGRGWAVTAVDVSATVLARLAARAAERGLGERVQVQQHDLSRTFPDGGFDLVSAQYLQSPVDFPREQVLRRAASAVALGGRLLIVTHASVPPWSWADPDTTFPTPAQALAALELDLDRWEVVRLQDSRREATGPAARRPPSPTPWWSSAAERPDPGVSGPTRSRTLVTEPTPRRRVPKPTTSSTGKSPWPRAPSPRRRPELDGRPAGEGCPLPGPARRAACGAGPPALARST